RITRRVGTPRPFFMSTDAPFLSSLAHEFLAGEWSLAGLLHSAELLCGGQKRGRLSLAPRVLAACPQSAPLPLVARLIGFPAGEKAAGRLKDTRWVYWTRPRMTPARWLPGDAGLPALTTTAAVAEWLDLTARELDWFADCPGRRRRRHDGALNHYTY